MTNSKEERVHAVFEKIYTDYDRMNDIISMSQHDRWRSDVMHVMQVPVGAKALDLCCGTADWTIAIGKETGSSGEVVGLDFSQNMLSIGREKVMQSGLEHVTLVHGNAMELPYEDNTFDYVTIGFGMRNVPDRHVVMKEMQRVLKPGGLAVCLETSQPTIPGFRQGYYFYFKFIMPLLGKLFARSYEEYVWLHESSASFPGAKALAADFERAGFQDVSFRRYTMGVVAAHFARKP
ncbi:MAG: demethylmenaquinone methyltransferase [Bacilli bacterium]